MRFENVEVFGKEAAFRAMRNPFRSWDRSNRLNDIRLAETLVSKGNGEDKFLRQIYFTVDIKGIPRYVLMELSTYKVGTVINSGSTMQTLMRDGISLDDIEFDRNDPQLYTLMVKVCGQINLIRDDYNKTDDPFEKARLLRKAKQILPEGLKTDITFSGNYAVARNIYSQRKNHRLPEWSEEFCKFFESLDDSWLITMEPKRNFKGFEIIHNSGKKVPLSENMLLTADGKILLYDNEAGGFFNLEDVGSMRVKLK